MISTDTPANVTETEATPHERSRPVRRDPRFIALGLLATYLAGTGVLFVLDGDVWRASLHAIGVVASLRLIAARKPWMRVVGDLLPLVAMALLYAELPALIAATGAGAGSEARYHDVVVQGWEAWIFGGQPSRTLASMLPWKPLSEVLHLGYLAYYPLIFAPGIVLLRRGERRGLGETVLAFTATYLVCWVTFITMPVEGPRFLWGAPSGVPDGLVRRLTVEILAAGSSRGAAFPSSHMAIATAAVVMAFRWTPPHAVAYSVVAFSIGVGAVYGGFHYGVDMLAGALVGAAVAAGVIFSFSKRRTSLFFSE